MESLYHKLKMTSDDFCKFLQKEYDDGKSQSQIAKDLKVNRTTIEQYWKKYNLKSRSLSDAAYLCSKNYDFTIKEKEILDGIMLADGHLESGSRTSRLTYGCKYKQTLDRIKNDLALDYNNYWQNPKDQCWFLKSLFYKELYSERQRWYPNGTKIVPKNIILTPTVCYWWYIGDGSNIKYGLELSTDSFIQEDVLFLIDKLNNLSIKATRQPSSNKIRISSKSKNDFLNYISKDIEIQNEYLYKWN